MDVCDWLVLISLHNLQGRGWCPLLQCCGEDFGPILGAYTQKISSRFSIPKQCMSCAKVL